MVTWCLYLHGPWELPQRLLRIGWGKMVHLITVLHSSSWHPVMKPSRVEHMCRLLKYLVIICCTQHRICKNPSAKSKGLRDTEPHALVVRSNCTRCKSLFASCWIWFQIREECLVDIGEPGIPTFWQLVSTYPLTMMKSVSLSGWRKKPSSLRSARQCFWTDWWAEGSVLGNEHADNLLSFWWDRLFPPSCFHPLRQCPEHLQAVLKELVGNPVHLYYLL